MIMDEHEKSRPEPVETRRNLERLRKAQVKFSKELRELADELRIQCESGESGETVDLYLDALDLLGIDGLVHPDITVLTRILGMRTLPHADSFWHSIVNRRRKKQLGTLPEKRLGINKEVDERFAHSLGAKTVETLYRGPFGEVPHDITPAVLKPVVSSDSYGAFYLFDDLIYSIANSRTVPNWEQLAEEVKRDLSEALLKNDLWEMQTLETLNGEPAPDIKCYSFYGEIGTILEVSRYPQQRYAYYDGDLNSIEFREDYRPQFDDETEISIASSTFDEARLETVRELSRQIPVPFMRIDFLNTDGGLVFCEFSSAPGMSHALVPAEDRRLGRMYLEAEIRLTHDLLSGKRFDAYEKYVD